MRNKYLKLIVVLFSSLVVCKTATAQEVKLWENWNAAYQATVTAMEADDLTLASEAAKAAVFLYREDNPDFDLNSFLTLVYNAAQIIQKNQGSARKMVDFLHPNIQYVFDNYDDYPERFIDICNLYGVLYLTNLTKSSNKSFYKPGAKFIARMRDAAIQTLGPAHSKTLIAEYNTIMIERYTHSKRYIRRAFQDLHERAIAFEDTKMAILTMSALAGFVTVHFNDHDGAIALIEKTVDLVGAENLTKKDRKNLFTIVAASLFMEHGVDKAEQMLINLPYLEAPALNYEEDGYVTLTPLRRYTPDLYNILSNGTMVLSFTVNRKGRPEDIIFLSSDFSGSNKRAAIEAISRWQYLPDYRNGKFQPVKNVKVVIRVTPE